MLTSCDICMFHEMQPVAMPDGTAVIGKEQMVCKRFPPQVVAMQVPTPQGISVSLMPMFPPVNAGMWCHEFAAGDASPDGAQDSNNA